MNKKDLSERDICTKFITPAVKQAGWDVLSQIREEVAFTKGRIIVRGRLVTRGKAKRADYILQKKKSGTKAKSRTLEGRENNFPIGLCEFQGLAAFQASQIGIVPRLLIEVTRGDVHAI